MNAEERQSLAGAAEAAAGAHPAERVLSFEWNGQTYWLKKKQGNNRIQAVKYSVEREFYYEVARISIARSCADCAPDMVLLTDRYFVLRDGGKTVHDWLLSDRTDEEKRRVMAEAGRALCRLHRAGLYHGRPALRDMTWDGVRMTFLDWENRTYFHDLPHRQMTDAVLFIQGMFRESWMKEEWVQAAWDGYASEGGAALLRDAAAFLRRHRAIAGLTGILHPFHFKDVEPLRSVYRWFLAHEAALSGN